MKPTRPTWIVRRVLRESWHLTHFVAKQLAYPAAASALPPGPKAHQLEDTVSPFRPVLYPGDLHHDDSADLEQFVPILRRSKRRVPGSLEF